MTTGEEWTREKKLTTDSGQGVISNAHTTTLSEEELTTDSGQGVIFTAHTITSSEELTTDSGQGVISIATTITSPMTIEVYPTISLGEGFFFLALTINSQVVMMQILNTLDYCIYKELFHQHRLYI